MKSVDLKVWYHPRNAVWEICRSKMDKIYDGVHAPIDDVMHYQCLMFIIPEVRRVKARS